MTWLYAACFAYLPILPGLLFARWIRSALGTILE